MDIIIPSFIIILLTFGSLYLSIISNLINIYIIFIYIIFVLISSTSLMSYFLVSSLSSWSLDRVPSVGMEIDVDNMKWAKMEPDPEVKDRWWYEPNPVIKWCRIRLFASHSVRLLSYHHHTYHLLTIHVLCDRWANNMSETRRGSWGRVSCPSIGCQEWWGT